ncbi:unnamed protein product, partial [Meganyctiphanes norvegica]
MTKTFFLCTNKTYGSQKVPLTQSPSKLPTCAPQTYTMVKTFIAQALTGPQIKQLKIELNLIAAYRIFKNWDIFICIFYSFYHLTENKYHDNICPLRQHQPSSCYVNIIPGTVLKQYRVSLNNRVTLNVMATSPLTLFGVVQGYGNITPRTVLGKVSTILYAVMGMPLFLLYMTNVGEVLANVFKFIYFKACRCGIGSLGYYRSASGTIRPVTSSMNEANGMDSNQKTVPIIWCLLVIGTYVFFGGFVFSRWEQWSLLDGCYFCYISLTTIGMGDLVPEGTVGGSVRHSASKLSQETSNTTSGYLKTLSEVESQQVVCTVYLLVGMALLAMCFSLMQEEAIENLKAFWRNLGCMRKKEREDEDSEEELDNTPGGG